MATFVANGNNPVDMYDLYDLKDVTQSGVTVVDHTSSTFTVSFDGHYVRYYSSSGDFTYPGGAASFPHGTITKIDVFHGSILPADRLYQFSGFSYDAQECFADSTDHFTVTRKILANNNSSIIGSHGDDVLIGWSGGDRMVGLDGDDHYSVDDPNDIVDETGGSGEDTVIAVVDFDLSDTTHVKGAVENLSLGMANGVKATGNSLDNTIVGNNFANILDGRGGADHLIGGKGDDLYIVDNRGDVVEEKAVPGDGVDTVQSSVSFSLADPVHALGQIEKLTLTGTGSINGTGNGLANTILGNNAANLINGGAGADTMRGLGGNDTYVVDNPGDIVDETYGSGTDTVRASISFSLADHVHAIDQSKTSPLPARPTSMAPAMSWPTSSSAISASTSSTAAPAATASTAVPARTR